MAITRYKLVGVLRSSAGAPSTSSIVWVRKLIQNDCNDCKCQYLECEESLTRLGHACLDARLAHHRWQRLEIEGRRPFVALRKMVRGWEVRLFLAGVFLQVCCQFLPAACRQTAHSRILGQFRLCIMSRRMVYFVRISFEKLTNPRLKWFAALVKFKGKEFEPTGNVFQVEGALSNLAPLNRWPQCVSVFMSGFHAGDVR